MRLTAQLAAAALSILALGACNQTKKVEAKNESVASVADKVAKSDIRFEPGRWESQMKLVKMDIPGMPPEAAKAMQQMMGQGRTFASCLTPEEAAKPGGKFFGSESKTCTYDTFTMGGGRIDAKMSCKSGEGVQALTLAGTYTPQTYDMTVSVKGKGPAGKDVDMQMALAAKRTGECTGKEM